MKKYSAVLAVVGALFVLAVSARIAYSQAKPASGTVQVHMVITDQAVNDDSEMPALTAENVQVKQGKDVLKVDQVIPARDDNGALQLFILIDETCDAGIGNNLNDLRDFINAQPATAMVGIAYMSNATVQILHG
jgi:lipopolysaccharide export system protein LptA